MVGRQMGGGGATHITLCKKYVAELFQMPVLSPPSCLFAQIFWRWPEIVSLHAPLARWPVVDNFRDQIPFISPRSPRVVGSVANRWTRDGPAPHVDGSPLRVGKSAELVFATVRIEILSVSHDRGDFWLSLQLSQLVEGTHQRISGELLELVMSAPVARSCLVLFLIAAVFGGFPQTAASENPSVHDQIYTQQSVQPCYRLLHRTGQVGCGSRFRASVCALVSFCCVGVFLVVVERMLFERLSIDSLLPPAPKDGLQGHLRYAGTVDDLDQLLAQRLSYRMALIMEPDLFVRLVGRPVAPLPSGPCESSARSFALTPPWPRCRVISIELAE